MALVGFVVAGDFFLVWVRVLEEEGEEVGITVNSVALVVVGREGKDREAAAVEEDEDKAVILEVEEVEGWRTGRTLDLEVALGLGAAAGLGLGLERVEGRAGGGINIRREGAEGGGAEADTGRSFDGVSLAKEEEDCRDEADEEVEVDAAESAFFDFPSFSTAFLALLVSLSSLSFPSFFLLPFPSATLAPEVDSANADEAFSTASSTSEVFCFRFFFFGSEEVVTETGPSDGLNTGRSAGTSLAVVDLRFFDFSRGGLEA
jgi:hypothetical protein